MSPESFTVERLHRHETETGRRVVITYTWFDPSSETWCGEAWVRNERGPPTTAKWTGCRSEAERDAAVAGYIKGVQRRHRKR
jgi:hypothetical protein